MANSMETAHHPKMPVLPAWSEAIHPNPMNFVFLLTVIAVMAGSIYFFTRTKKKRKVKYPGRGQGDGNPRIVNFNAGNILSDDGDAPLLKIGDTVSVELIDGTLPFNAKIINVGNHKFTITLPAGSTMQTSCAVGAAVKVVLNVDRTPYTLPTTVEKYYSDKFLACTLHHLEPVTFNNLRRMHRLTGEIPTLFTILPDSVVVGNCIPFADLHNKVFAEIPGKIVELHVADTVIRTRSPIAMHINDLLMFQTMLPDNSEEVTIWGRIASIREMEGEERGVRLLGVPFLTLDDNLANFLTSHAAQSESGSDAIDGTLI